MPEYLAPGVFVEETSFRSKSIEGVGTSVAGMVGPTRTGPVRGVPEVVTSFADYVRVFGGVDDLAFAEGVRPNYSAMAAKAFFDNGGKQLYVVRTVAGVNTTDANGSGGSAQFGVRADGAGNVHRQTPRGWESRSQGQWQPPAPTSRQAADLNRHFQARQYGASRAMARPMRGGGFRR